MFFLQSAFKFFMAEAANRTGSYAASFDQSAKGDIVRQPGNSLPFPDTSDRNQADTSDVQNARVVAHQSFSIPQITHHGISRGSPHSPTQPTKRVFSTLWYLGLGTSKL